MVADLDAGPIPALAERAFGGRAFGLDLESAYPIPGLAAGVGACARRTVCRADSVDGLEQVWTERGSDVALERRFPDGRLFMSIRHQPEQGYRIWAARYGRHVVSADGRNVWSVLPQRGTFAWQRLFFAQTLPLAAALQGLEVLHASAVALHGSAIAFTAASGTGKSSLAAHLVADGATFLTDDVLALEARAHDVLAYQGPARTSVSAQELKSMSRPGRARLGPRVGTADKSHFEPEVAPEPARLAVLYRVVRSDRFTQARLSEQRPPEARAILGSSFLSYLRTESRLLNQLAVCDRVASTVRVFDFEVPGTLGARDAAALVRRHADEALAG